MEEILIVDGYNVIGAWPELRQLKEKSLEEARLRLVEILAEYQAFSGRKVLVVFDAHQVPGRGRENQAYRVKVFYTAENETADECIERLVKEYQRRRRQIYVATSDRTEQWVVFAQGALRISARELAVEVEKSQAKIEEKVRESHQALRQTVRERLHAEIEKIFEKWRRE